MPHDEGQDHQEKEVEKNRNDVEHDDRQDPQNQETDGNPDKRHTHSPYLATFTSAVSGGFSVEPWDQTAMFFT